MSKKSRKNAAHNTKNLKSNNIIHPVFEPAGWHPLDEKIDGRRDQKYVKNIKPRSDGQAELIKAICDFSLTLAIGHRSKYGAKKAAS